MMPSKPESGQVTLFGIGLVVVLVFVGGVSLDLWRVLGTQRALSEMADGAAAAGGNGIDTSAIWSGGDPVLDPELAEALAYENLAAQTDREGFVGARIDASSGEQIVVVVNGEVDLVLLDMFGRVPPIEIQVTATARPARGGI